MESKGLHSEKCKLLLLQHPQFTNELMSVFNQTKYFKRTQVEDVIKKLVLNYCMNRKKVPLYINLPKDKIGSEHWLYLQYKDILPPHTIVNDNQIIDGELLYVDDWCISGSNAVLNLNKIIYTSKWLLGQYDTTNIKLTFIFSSVTDNGLDHLNNIISLLYKSKKQFIYDSVIQKFSCDNDDFKTSWYSGHNDGQYSIHSDYKIPDCKSFINIYKKCNLETNTKFMESVKKLF
jgi:hypothetical protein